MPEYVEFRPNYEKQCEPAITLAPQLKVTRILLRLVGPRKGSNYSMRTRFFHRLGFEALPAKAHADSSRTIIRAYWACCKKLRSALNLVLSTLLHRPILSFPPERKVSVASRSQVFFKLILFYFVEQSFVADLEKFRGAPAIPFCMNQRATNRSRFRPAHRRPGYCTQA